MFNITFINKFLDKFFKKDDQAGIAKKSVVFGIIISVFLIAIKCAAWLVMDSISMQASMNDSALDTIASLLAYHALKYSMTLFDEEHNFGHGKAEGLMSLIQCLFIIISGFFIFYEAYERFFKPKSISNIELGIWVMIISCIAVYALVYVQKYAITKTDSMLVKGDFLHYLSDLLMNVGVMVSLILSSVFPYIDILCGVFVGSYVLWNAFEVIKTAIVDLMDESLSKKICKNIQKKITNIAGVISIDRLRTRSAGMVKYVEIIATVDSTLSIIAANDIANKIKKTIDNLFEIVDVVVKVVPLRDVEK